MKKIISKIWMAPTSLLFTFLLIAVLTGFIVGFTEYSAFERVKSDQVVGLNEIWQLNMFSNSPVNLSKYDHSTTEANMELQNLFGYRGTPGLKDFFEGFVNSAASLQPNSAYDESLLTDSSKSHTALWSVRQDVAYATHEVNYNEGQIIGKIQPKFSLNNVIFSHFVEYLRENLVGLTDSKKILANNYSGEFKRYNRVVLQSVLGNQGRDLYVLNELLKIHRFFIASRRINPETQQADTAAANGGNMLVYPAHPFETFNKLDQVKAGPKKGFDPSSRPWYEAAFLNTFPYGFEQGEGKVVCGLTGIYNDIQSDNSVLLQDRTFFCRFKLPLIKNYEYVACVDLFLDDSEFGTNKFILRTPNKIFGFRSLTSALMPISYRAGFLGDGILTSILVLTLLLSTRKWLYQIIKRQVQKFDIDERYLEFSLVRQEPRMPIPRRFDDHKMSMTILQTKIDEYERTLTTKAGLSLDAINKLFSLGVEGGFTRKDSDQLSRTVNYNFDITLGIDNTNIYRCIEFWGICDMNQKEIGMFIVKWLNTIYTKEEIAITLIGPLQAFESDMAANKIISRIKKRLEEHLLQSEKANVKVRIDLADAEHQKFDIPDALLRKGIGADNFQTFFMKKGYTKRLLERKLVFQSKDKNDDEFKLFLKLYESDVDLYAVCGISFLKNLDDQKKLDNFLKETVDKERIIIESRENEFREFYSSLDDEIKERFTKSNLEKFYLASFADLTRQAIYKNYDFALAKNNQNETQYVLFFYDNSTSMELGWVSWRQVDTEFYERVYSLIKTDMKEPISIRKVISGN